MKKVFKPINKTIKDVSEDVTESITVTSEQNDRALANIKDKLSEIFNNRCKIASYLLSLLSRPTKSQHTSQAELVKSLDLNRVSDLLKNDTIPVTLYDSLLATSETDKKLKLAEKFLKIVSNKSYNVDLANLSDKRSLILR